MQQRHGTDCDVDVAKNGSVCRKWMRNFVDVNRSMQTMDELLSLTLSLSFCMHAHMCVCELLCLCTLTGNANASYGYIHGKLSCEIPRWWVNKVEPETLRCLYLCMHMCVCLCVSLCVCERERERERERDYEDSLSA